MEKLFGGFAKSFKLKVAIDSFVFKLNYRFTTIILIAASVVVTAKLFIGEPINCISKDDIPIKLLNTFCWIHSTFSVESAWFKKVGDEVPYPGVDKFTKGESRVYHAYYQWVCFVLFLQAVFFYLPHYFWKCMERGLLKNLVSPYPGSEVLVNYFKDSSRTHNNYFLWYMFSMVWNFVNIIAQIYIVDTFLGKEFTTYGTNVINFTDWDWKVRYDPMLQVFPRMAKCTFHRYGSSGDVQRHDALCLLPINIINEKIYVFMWFWFVILAVFTGVEIIYHFLLILFPKYRFHSIYCYNKVIDESQLRSVLENSSYGSIFLLNGIKKNVDSSTFRSLVLRLSGEKLS